MDTVTVMQALAVVFFCGLLASIYGIVEKFNSTVRNAKDRYLYVDRAPEAACNRDYTP